MCVPPATLLLGTVTHSDIDMPLRPRRGVGCQALRSPGTNTWLGVHAQGQQPVPCYCFLIPHWVTSRNGTPPHPHPQNSGQQSSLCHRGLFALQISRESQNKQFQPQPLKCPGHLNPTATMVKESKLSSCAGRLRATALPSPSPFRTSGLGRNRSCLTKSKWRRKKRGVARTPPCLSLQQSPP